MKRNAGIDLSAYRDVLIAGIIYNRWLLDSSPLPSLSLSLLQGKRTLAYAFANLHSRSSREESQRFDYFSESFLRCWFSVCRFWNATLSFKLRHVELSLVGSRQNGHPPWVARAISERDRVFHPLIFSSLVFTLRNTGRAPASAGQIATTSRAR